MGRDLILGAAAAGSSRLTAIKLGMILKMLGMNEAWCCQRKAWCGGTGSGRGGGGGGGNKEQLSPSFGRHIECDRSKCHLPEHFSYKYASSPLMSPSRHKQTVKPLLLTGGAQSFSSHSCLSGVICRQ